MGARVNVPFLLVCLAVFGWAILISQAAHNGLRTLGWVS